MSITRGNKNERHNKNNDSNYNRLRRKNINYLIIEDMRSNLKRLLNQFATTSNCPSNWRNLRVELQEEYKDNEFILDIIKEI